MSDTPLAVAGVFPLASVERSIARAVAIGLVVLLALQVVRSSAFNTVDRVEGVAAATGLTRVPGFEPLSAFDPLNLIVHVTIVLVTLAVPAFRRGLSRFRTVSIFTLAYGAVVIGSTVMSLPYVMVPRNVGAALIPMTILSLGVCLPAMFDLDDYDVLFQGVVLVLALTAIASLWLVATQRPTFFGQPLIPPIDPRGGKLLAAGLFVHRNTIGSFQQFGPALAMYLAARHRSLRWVYGVALVLITTHLLLTFSRSSQIVAAISLLPVLFALRQRRLLAYGAAALVAVGGILVATVPEFRDYAGLGASLSSRDRVWLGIFHQSIQRPVFGAGLLNVEFWEHGIKHSPHNLLLAQFAFFGLVGLSLFLMVLITFGELVVQNLRRHRHWVETLMTTLVIGTLLQGIVEYIVGFPVFFANSMFWICLGLAAHTDGLADRR